MTDKLPLDAKIALTAKMVEDLEFYIESKSQACPAEQHFKIVSRDEDLGVERAARMAAFKNLNTGIKKVAFDTRRIDQEKDRNPRRNLQYWHRSENFIDDESKEKIEVFDKLAEVVNELKSELSVQPEWFDSYVRVLSTNLDRVKIKRAGDSSVEVFKPHLSYLEQIIYNRYRLTLKDIKKASKQEIRDRLLSKDESLKERREFLMSTGGFDAQKKVGDSTVQTDYRDELLMTMAKGLASGNNEKKSEPEPQPQPNYGVSNIPGQPIIINQSPQNAGGQNYKDAAGALLEAPIRRAGEKSVERTITIKIVDSVVE